MHAGRHAHVSRPIAGRPAARAAVAGGALSWGAESGL
jgi:hypothetical protein